MNNDPFFREFQGMEQQMNAQMQQMQQMMGGFHSHFPQMLSPVDNHRGNSHRHGNQPPVNQSSHQHPGMMMPFAGGGVFGGGFGSMFQNMGAQMQSMRADPNAHSFSSSKVMTYSNNGDGAPKYYEATSETKQAPGGIKQTKKSERNSETGMHRMAVGHHIYDRGHMVERSQNQNTGDEEEHQNYDNMDEDDRDNFHAEWRERAGHPDMAVIGGSFGQRHPHVPTQSRAPRIEPRAITSRDQIQTGAERRPRHSHGSRDQAPRDHPRDSANNVRMKSRADDI